MLLLPSPSNASRSSSKILVLLARSVLVACAITPIKMINKIKIVKLINSPFMKKKLNTFMYSKLGDFVKILDM
jgi:hypothetical protein